MTNESEKRILSIQSHVVSGYVGNKSAVFPLQLLGFDVDIINSCMLANHTAYEKGAPGIRLNSEELTTIINGMKENGLLSSVTHLLTGYIGTPTFLNAIAETYDTLRQEKGKDFVYLCDPVLGDNGKLYVPKELIQIYIDKIIHLATILTPNAFELSLLSGKPVTSEESAFTACDSLHEKHKIPTIIVTGTRFDPDSKYVSVLVSSKTDKGNTRFAVDTQYIDATFSGTGDLLSALILAWNDKLPDNPLEAYQKAVASVTAVLRRTADDPKSAGRCPHPELRLIQSQEDILKPPTNLSVIRSLNKNQVQLGSI